MRSLAFLSVFTLPPRRDNYRNGVMKHPQLPGNWLCLGIRYRLVRFDSPNYKGIRGIMMDWFVMDWREWVILGLLVSFTATLCYVIGTAIRNANKK